MRDFAFLEKIIIGQYLPIDSWLHKRHPVSKLISFFVLLCGVTVSINLSGLLIGLGAVIILLTAGKIQLRHVLRGLLLPLPFLIILAIIQLFFPSINTHGKPLMDVFGFEIYREGLFAAVRLLLRFCVLVLLLSVSSATLSDLQFVHGLESLLKPLKLKTNYIVMTAQITLRFIPVIALNAEKVAKAQASRGAAWGTKKGSLIKRVRQMIPLLVPLVNNSLKQADTIADAMLARGFGSASERTSLTDYRMTVSDWVLIIISSLISVVIIWFPG